MKKGMKKLLCICLTLMLGLGLSACGSDNKSTASEPKTENVKEKAEKSEAVKEEVKEEPYVQGTVSGNHYESAWLNMKADFSDQFIMATQEEIEQAQSAGSEEMLTEDGKELVEEATVINEMMVVGIYGIPNCTIAVEKLPLANYTTAQYLEASKANIEASVTEDVGVTLDPEITKVEIAGQEYQCLKMVITTEGVELNSDIYLRVKDSYGVMINVTYNADSAAAKDEILAAFQPMK